MPERQALTHTGFMTIQAFGDESFAAGQLSDWQSW
jgi:hypothetical protein